MHCSGFLWPRVFSPTLVSSLSSTLMSQFPDYCSFWLKASFPCPKSTKWEDYIEHGYWMVWSTGSLSLQTSYYILPLSQQTTPDHVIHQRHFLEKAWDHCSKGTVERIPRRGNRKLTTHQGLCPMSHHCHDGPIFPFFLHCVSDP